MDQLAPESKGQRHLLSAALASRKSVQVAASGEKDQVACVAKMATMAPVRRVGIPTSPLRGGDGTLPTDELSRYVTKETRVHRRAATCSFLLQPSKMDAERATKLKGPVVRADMSADIWSI